MLVFCLTYTYCICMVKYQCCFSVQICIALKGKRCFLKYIYIKKMMTVFRALPNGQIPATLKISAYIEVTSWHLFRSVGISRDMNSSWQAVWSHMVFNQSVQGLMGKDNIFILWLTHPFTKKPSLVKEHQLNCWPYMFPLMLTNSKF